MSNRFAQVVILTEDERSANLLRRYVLRALKINNRRTRQLISPSAQGDAKQWVLIQYPLEVKEQRRKHSKTGLVVHLDADTETVAKRTTQLAETLKNSGQSDRKADEWICHAVPRRHTETWLCFLMGIAADEEQDCKRDKQLTDFDSVVQLAAAKLFDLTRANVAPPSLPSLAAAIMELRRLET